MVEVKQVDREAAREAMGYYRDVDPKGAGETPAKVDAFYQAFARHRQQETAKLREALEACRAWHYAEAKGLGSFRQRGDLCAYSEWKTQMALARVHPSYRQGDYKPVPVIFGDGSDEETIASWVQELIAEEIQALKETHHER